MPQALETAQYSPDQINQLMEQVRALPEAEQANILNAVTIANFEQHGNISQQQIASMMDAHLASINQQSTRDESLLVQGGYDTGVAAAVAGSVGVGADQETVQQASADFARMAAEAVRNGQPLDQIRFNDPNLTAAAQQAIYEQVAAQQGTSAAQIEQKAEEQRQADMQAVQVAVNPLAAALAGHGDVVKSFGAAMNNFDGTGQQTQNSGHENERSGWGIG